MIPYTSSNNPITISEAINTYSKSMEYIEQVFNKDITRRTVLAGLGTTAIGSQTASAVPTFPTERRSSTQDRLEKAYELRKETAHEVLAPSKGLPEQTPNGDHKRYDKKIADFTKGLPHNRLGEVDLDAYAALQHALETGRPQDFKQIPLGKGERKLVEPQAAYAYELVGIDSHQGTAPPAPSFASARSAAEVAELYWMALCRDVPFYQYEESELIEAGAEDLSTFSDYDGPTKNGTVTSDLIFRGVPTGNRTGPYLSQFLCQPIPHGALEIAQKVKSASPGLDYLTEYDEWLASQRGADPKREQTYQETRRYIHNGRALATYVHNDLPNQAYEAAAAMLNAASILVGNGVSLDPNIPYDEEDPVTPLLNFGFWDALDATNSCFDVAQSAAWYQKWIVHKRLRPEAFGGRVHNHCTGNASYPIHEELLDSPVLDRIYDTYCNYLLPQAYPEGCPLHPSYVAGHSTVAGASVTILKAYFDESHTFKEPMRPSADGTELVSDVSEELTVRGELNKLAANIANARNWAGIHYRSDKTYGLKLGEQVAISLLKGRGKLSNLSDSFNGFSLTTFDGETITIAP